MDLLQLKNDVFRRNLELVEHGLVVLTWGNVSGIDREAGLVAIKPSGVPYASMTAEDVVVVDLEGKTVEGRLNPSSDLPTHLALYRAFPSVGGIVHTHSPKAVAWAQARRGIPAFGTTHADHFHGAVPCTRELTPAEVADDYELNTGRVIEERFHDLDAEAFPGVLVAGHGPFTWGPTPRKAVENAVALEQIAAMALDTLRIDPDAEPAPSYVLDKHYFRKHGPGAYYGQKGIS
ncbi:MAG: L-ribulose-5-phosphate 4-epimerase [Kiritimatiellae bacterium]|jgi:L-ribulose-5-phosphate 4-epimerase|nr:L-ribulose-5-phosphate 4-epimerase [Kiritimatiellia bacterium]